MNTPTQPPAWMMKAAAKLHGEYSTEWWDTTTNYREYHRPYYEKAQARRIQIATIIAAYAPPASGDVSKPLTVSDALEQLVANLADLMKWNWTHQGISERDAADAVLKLMGKLGLLKHERHPSGGDIYTINERKYGRVD